MSRRRGRALVGIAGDVDPDLAERVVALGVARLAHRGDSQRFVDPVARVHGAVFGASSEPRAAAIELFVDESGELELRADAVGRRSLFVAARPRFVLFASELTALTSMLRALGEDVSLDLPAWRRFLAFSFIPAPRTPFQRVLQVPAGHRMTWSSLRGLGPAERWFDTPIALQTIDDDRDAIGVLLATLDDAVRVETEASPAGALFLSGGLDSAAIAASLARLSPGFLALTIDLEDDSEAEGAGEIAAALGLSHRRLAVTGRDVALALPQIVKSLDTPIGDPALAPFFVAARESGVSRLWNGEGGDQLLAGWATKPMLAWARYASPDDDVAAAYLRTFHKLADLEDEALGDALRQDRTRLEDDLRPYLSGPRAHRHEGFLHLLCDANLWLKGSGNLLPRMDRMCAAHGIDAVSPMLDPQFIALSFRLAPSHKQRGVTEKWVLREALRGALPAAALDRPKRGMRAPLRLWLEGPLAEIARDVLTSRAARERGFLQPSFLDALLADQVRAPDLRRRRRDEWLWLALVSELWLAEHAP